jgi:hypothetical protein
MIDYAASAIDIDDIVSLESTHRPVGILRGFGHAGDPLHWLGEIMMAPGKTKQRRWVIDNRAAHCPVALVELARFANQVKANPKQFSNLTIAWVGTCPMSSCLRSILSSLPLTFHEFDSFDAALYWLQD